jgi:hypothetical protein
MVNQQDADTDIKWHDGYDNLEYYNNDKDKDIDMMDMTITTTTATTITRDYNTLWINMMVVIYTLHLYTVKKLNGRVCVIDCRLYRYSVDMRW